MCDADFTLYTMAACYQGGYECARVLIEKGRADVHAVGKECDSTPLMFAALSGNVELVRLLLKYQGKVNSQNAAGKSALHFAAVGGHVEIIRLLLSSGASCKVHDEQGRSARVYAEEKGQREAATVLSRAEDIEVKEALYMEDSNQVRLTFEKLDTAVVRRKAEMDRKYEERRRAQRQQQRPPKTADPGAGGGGGGMWVPIGDDDEFMGFGGQGPVPRVPKAANKGVGRKKEDFAGAVRAGGDGDANKGGRAPRVPDEVGGAGGGGVELSPRREGGSPAENLEFLDKELQAIVGMDNVKKLLRSLCKKVSVDQKRAKFGFQNDQNLNMLFLGAPGTGKTSMARVVAKLLRHLGVVEKGHLVEVSRKDLVAEYSGQSAVKTAGKVQEALGGVLFVDEAYALKHEGSKDSFGQEAVDTLVSEMENHRKRLVVIMAGYTKEMGDFMRSNSGLDSRFPHTFEFACYTYPEMADIFVNMAHARKLVVAVERGRLAQLVAEQLPRSEAAKGNARSVRNLLERVLARQTDRVADKGTVSMESLLTLLEEDFSVESGEEERGGAAGGVEGVLRELDGIVGIAEVKDLFATLRAKVTIAAERRALGLAADGASSLHMIFEGSPGTGKTTVARLMGRLFKAVNVLPRGHLVEVSRVDLVGQHVGETAPKTQQVIERAAGGVLFVDEAYTLVGDGKDAFGREALETIMKSMEDMRDELVVILAGYTQDMERLLQANSGLKSRFPVTVHFPDYSGDELVAIADGMLESPLELKLTPGARERLVQVCHAQARLHDPLSGNARFVRNLLEKACLRQAQRLVQLPSRSKEQLTTLEEDDLGVPPAEMVLSGLVLAEQTQNILAALAAEGRAEGGAGGAAQDAAA